MDADTRRLRVCTESGQPIVVGVDGSQPSVAALRWALREARFVGCGVEVVHAWVASVSPFNDLSIARANHHSEEVAAREVLDAAVAQARDAEDYFDVPVRVELVAGYPATVLRARARARAARILVVGNARHRSMTGRLHKTVPQMLTKDPPCRVLVVAVDGAVVSDSALPTLPM